MNNIDKSPFTMNRFEHENVHLYYLDESTINTLESLKSIYIVGSRGTGKTTMLTALSYEERFENASLKTLLNNNPFESKVLGVYVKLPEFQIRKIDNWLQQLSHIEDYAVLFSLYLDLISVELLCRATAKLLSENIINTDSEREFAFVRKCRENMFSMFGKHFSEKTHLSLIDLSKVCERVRSEIELWASREKSPLDFIANYSICQIGKIGRDFGNDLIKNIYPNTDSNAEMKWHCKICFDESECLSDKQKIVLNTMIRLSKYPVFYVASFVYQPIDSFSTTIPNISVANPDCHFISIDKAMQEDSVFRKFVEGVSTIRIRHVLKDDNATFDLSKILGKLSINKLLQELLFKSVSPDVQSLLDEARVNAAKGFFKDQFIEETDNPLPIFQTYLIKKLSLTPNIGQENWAQRKEDSESFRKKMVAAYLSICNEFKMDVIYSSVDMVLQMSDTCIRDYLSQMDSIFKAAEMTLKDFLQKQISVDIQDRALKKASDDKLESMPKGGAKQHRECTRLVEAIGKLTKELQSRHPENKHLIRTELGQFCVNFPEMKGFDLSKEKSVLRESIEYGYLRVISESTNKISFRLHTSLAPHFRTSYRGAYYESIIDPLILSFFINTGEPEERNPKIASVVSAIYNDEILDSSPISLFE